MLFRSETPALFPAKEAATTFEKTKSDLLGHYMPEREAATRPEFTLTQPQAPDLRQMELPLEERRAVPEISPAQLQLPFTEQGAANVAARPIITEPAPAGATGQPAAGESISEPLSSTPPAGEGTVDAGATGVGTAVEPAAGTVEGKRDERPALDTVGGTAGIEIGRAHI